MTQKHTIEIPENMLLTLATRGNMGGGEMPKLMQTWALQECNRLGLSDKMRAEQEAVYQELKMRAANVWGDGVVERIEKLTTVVGKVLGEVARLDSDKTKLPADKQH